jgi:hypothetical protein
MNLLLLDADVTMGGPATPKWNGVACTGQGPVWQ